MNNPLGYVSRTGFYHHLSQSEIDGVKAMRELSFFILAPRPHAGLRFEREPTWPAGRKRNADQTSSMAMMDTARHPALLMALRITSRLRSRASFEVFFG